MGLKIGEGEENEETHLLFASICMVGLSVEVQIKDGSLYSGIFHTASFVHGDDGIILKKARKIRKGKHEKSFTEGSLIDTLVISSADFVQVVVKDFPISAGGESGDVSNDGVEAVSIDVQDNSVDLEREPNSSITRNSASTRILDHNKEKQILYNKNAKVYPSDNLQEIEARRQDVEKAAEVSLKPTVISQASQVGEDKTEGQESSCNVDNVINEKNVVHEDSCSNRCNVCSPRQVGSIEDTQSEKASASRPFRPDDHVHTNSMHGQTSSVPNHSASVSVSRASSTSPSMLISNKNSCSSGAKESKLNPAAKVFSPASANSRHLSTVLPSVRNTGYMSNITPMMPTTAVAINSLPSHLSVTAKLAQYDSLVTGYNGIPAQYPRPVIGHVNAWQQPVRLTGQYHPVQAGPTYMHPSAPSVMVGRMGQLVYVHPVTQDAILGGTAFSRGPPYPLLNSGHTAMPKIQGTVPPSLPFGMTPPPPVVIGNQPLATPAHMPFPQPVSSIRPIPMIPVPVHGFFGNKFR